MLQVLHGTENSIREVPSVIPFAYHWTTMVGKIRMQTYLILPTKKHGCEDFGVTRVVKPALIRSTALLYNAALRTAADGPEFI